MSDSLTTQVARAILEYYITSGRLRPGDALPPLRELELQYEASMATVAHAIGQLQALGWVVKGKGRRAVVAERSVAESDSGGNIGLLLSYDRSAALPMRIYKGVEEACRVEGYHVVVATTPSMFYADEREALLRLRDAGCRAIVMNPTVRTETELAEDYLNSEFQDIPIVLVDLAWPQQRRSQVVFDNFGAGLGVTQHFLSRGHTRIAFMTLGRASKLMWRSSVDRHQGYLAALKRAGIAPEPELEWEVNPFEDAYEQCWHYLDRWRAMKKRDRPTAIVAVEDEYASALIGDAQEIGVSVPEELVVAGFDNTANHPPIRHGFLTTAPNFVSAGEKAVELALRHLRGELNEPVTYMLPAPPVQRSARRGQSSVTRALS